MYYLTRFTSNKSADHLQQVGPTNITFPPIYEEEKADVERGVYETNNQPKRETFNYEKEGLFCLGVAKVKSKEYGTITGNIYPMFDYTGKKMVPIYD